MGLDKITTLQEREKKIREELKKISTDFDDAIKEYYNECCDYNIDKYRKYLDDISEYLAVKGDKSLWGIDREFNQLIDRSLKNLISNRVIIDVPWNNRTGSQITVYKRGFGHISDHYPYSKKISGISSYKKLFDIDLDFSEYVFKSSKKKIIKCIQKNIKKWIPAKDSFQNFKTNIHIPEEINLTIIHKYSSYGIDTKTLTYHPTDLEISITKYNQSIIIRDNGKFISRLYLDSSHHSTKDCYHLAVLFDYITPALEEIKNEMIERYKDNQKILSDVKEEIAHCIIAEEL